MSQGNNTTCAICGKGYHLCVSCKDDLAAAPWKMHTDTSEHYKIFQIIHGYSTGVYTKREAKAKLKMVDLSDYDTLREHIKKAIDEIRESAAPANVKAHEPKIGDEQEQPVCEAVEEQAEDSAEQ